jgi:gamma-glutamyltranspeptidase/glutathione hydrolase
LVEEFDLTAMSVSERFHLFAEAMKVCWPERLRRFGDPRVVDIDLETELSDSFTATLSEKLKAGLKSPQRGEVVYHEPMNCTSHISTADAQGNMVSLTQTHGGGFGSMVTVPGTGLLFGHGVGRFDPRPGLANSVGPEKRPLHNMAPFLATREGMPFATYGIPGGRTIPNNQLNISVSLFDLEVPIQQALDAPRLHTDGAEPIQVEPSVGEETLAALRELGHEVTASAGIGGPGHGIRLWENGTYQDGGTDPRGEGKVITK